MLFLFLQEEEEEEEGDSEGEGEGEGEEHTDDGRQQDGVQYDDETQRLIDGTLKFILLQIKM